MKKVVCVGIFMICLCLFAACQPSNIYSPEESAIDIQPAPTIAPPSNIYIGMPIDAFNALYPKEDGNSQFRLYRFFEDDNGNPGVVTLPSNAYAEVVVLSVAVYDKTNIIVSEEAFRSLEKGMTMHEVVSFVGNPHGATPDGLCSVWNCDDGQFYVEWRNSPNEYGVLLVGDVRRVNEATGFSESIFD